MKKAFLYFTILFCGLYSAQESKTILAGKQISINYPASYVKSYDLHDDAMLQMSNSIAEKYSIIIQDEKAGLQFYQLAFNNLEDAVKFYSKNLSEGLEKSKTSKISLGKVGDHNIAQITIEGINTDEESGEKSKIFYLFSLVETQDYYYQILSWTLFENKDKYVDEFKNIASTFKEIK